jgi:hypothetical protein
MTLAEELRIGGILVGRRCKDRETSRLAGEIDFINDYV